MDNMHQYAFVRYTIIYSSALVSGMVYSLDVCWYSRVPCVRYVVFIIALYLVSGFVLSYKKEHNAWKSVRLGPTNRTYIAAGLMCGTQYRFTVHAFNRLGDSPDSQIVEAKTNGSGKDETRVVWGVGWE